MQWQHGVFLLDDSSRNSDWQRTEINGGERKVPVCDGQVINVE